MEYSASSMISSLIYRRWSRLWGTLVLILVAGALSAAEIWDATTLDPQGKRTSLAGMWEFMPWASLEKIPDFKNARPLQVPRAQMEGAYRTRFSIGPVEGRVLLGFDAVAFRCAVFVNGALVGNHAGGMTPFEMDITSHIHVGSNELVVLVLGAKGRALSAESADATQIAFNERGQALSSGGDKTVLGGGAFPGDGIRQGVFLRQVPLLRVGDVTLVTSYRQGQLRAEVEIENQTPGDASVLIQLDILPYDIASKKIGDAPVWTKSQKWLAKRGGNAVAIVQPWKNPQWWMPGDPHLYVARLRLSNEAGQLLDERNVRFGFREVWLDGRQIMVNGMPFRAFVHGTLDAEASPEVIRAMFKQVMATGINMVRPHTRPPVPAFAQIADEMGMALIGESELCFNSNYAYEEPVFWSNYERLFRERIARDKNHPSILIWSLANEVVICSPGAKIGQHFYDAFLHLRQADRTRPFMQEGDGDLRDMAVGAKGFPIDIINLHPYDISSTKNPLWASEFPQVAWTLDRVKYPKEIPATNKFGDELPDRNRPWFMGEFGLAGAGYPDVLSFWTGPGAYRDLFGDAGELVRSLGEITNLQLQAFRDMNMVGMDPWDMPDKEALTPFLRRGLEPVTTFTRDLFGHWTGGQTASRDLVTLNDSFTSRDLLLTVVLKRGNLEISRIVEKFRLAPGARQETHWRSLMPAVRERTPLDFEVQLCDEKGKQVSGFRQNWLLYPEISPASDWRAEKVWLCGKEESFDRIESWSGLRVRPPSSLGAVNRQPPAVVIVDQSAADSLDEKDRRELDRFVQSGGILMYLGVNQVPTDAEALVSNPDSDSTRLFLLRKSPLTKGTTALDWEFWRPDHLVSRGNYTMAFDPVFDFPLVGGGRNGPMYAPLGIVRKGRGALLGCRLELNHALPDEPVAKLFLNNLVSYAATLGKSPASAVLPLLLLCPPGEKEAWQQRMARAGIPFAFGDESTAFSGKQTVLLCGNATISPIQFGALRAFVAAGGKLWLHRLSPSTSYLDRLSAWLGQPVALAPSKMWLQQLELVSPNDSSPLLNGINDFLTCWATFGWTNGEMSKVRTTSIVDYVLSADQCKGEALLREPGWLGKWNFGPGTYTLSQAIVREIGTHEKNSTPGLGLATYKYGKGTILLDQLRWDDVMMDQSGESADKARYLAGTLWKNLRDQP